MYDETCAVEGAVQTHDFEDAALEGVVGAKPPLFQRLREFKHPPRQIGRFLRRPIQRSGLETDLGQPLTQLGLLAGEGVGIDLSFAAQLERDLPIELTSSFEGSMLVVGGVWAGNELIGPHCSAALAKLRWSAHADDLPMHVHEHTDRFIIVHEGRGFFHVSEQSLDTFDGTGVRTIPARERDVLVFTRGVIHTFSTLDEPMMLLSCQLPYIPFESKDQYGLPAKRWIARENPEPVIPRVACDPAWSVLAAG